MSGYKINSNKSVAFLYRNDKQTKKEVRETTPFSRVTKITKYRGITLTNEMKDLYNKKIKSLKKEIGGNIMERSSHGSVEFQHTSSQALKGQFSISYRKTNKQTKKPQDS